MAISPGTVRGKVRVVLSKTDAQSLKPGEIMVARFTDVGWTPYYGIVAGLITEIGSSLSHGAVVAREYGLPLVSNIENVTLLLKTGDSIEMNGTTGEIRLLS
jgi:pyruvate,water dikinase